MFQQGDEVSFLNDTGKATVVRIIDKKRVELITQEGITIPASIKDLVKLTKIDDEDSKIKTKSILKTIDRKSIPAKTIKSSKNTQRAIEEVDLHIEELVDNIRGMSNAAIINIQLNHFKLKLEQAIAANALRIVFIHGVGNGKLKAEIHKILRSYDSIRHQDGSYSKYGFGATEVLLK